MVGLTCRSAVPPFMIQPCPVPVFHYLGLNFPPPPNNNLIKRNSDGFRINLNHQSLMSDPIESPTETSSETSSETPSQRVIQIGPDQVTVTDRQVVIDAKHEMPEWTIGGARPAPIYFEEKRYLLVAKDPVKGRYAWRYVLHPWPDGKQSNPNLFFHYDADAVAEREGNRRGDAADSILGTMLLPFYPFLGSLWSGMQERLVRFGFIPRSLTGISIFINFCLFFAQGVLFSIMINGSARSGKMMVGGVITALSGHNFVLLGSFHFPLGVLDAILGLSLAADSAMRYTYYLRENEWTGGFLEWLIPKGKPKN